MFVKLKQNNQNLLLEKTNDNFNATFMNTILKGNPERVFLCGPPKMNSELSSFIDKKQIEIL